MKRQSFKSVGEIRSKRKLQLAHSDICGPSYANRINWRKMHTLLLLLMTSQDAVQFISSRPNWK